MAAMVDARGLACPQPVIQTRKAMQSGAAQVVTLVDNETSLTNVSRMAKKAGWQVHVTAEGDDFRIEMQRGEAAPQARPAPSESPAAPAPGGPLVLVVSADVMGRGHDELGGILIRGFFHTLGEVEPRPQMIIFFNTGVRLACEGSPVLDDLRALEESGIEMLACGTCLDYLALKETLAVGQVSNMYDIAGAILGAGKVVYL
ncbi:MAG TPA: sulfurtransferase-like selenium metabolism protein YedF [Anaerolineae bacterium]|nr:sulfurtransferase-like selenium metabolism protein YedF [Anaerolineae bacterium]